MLSQTMRRRKFLQTLGLNSAIVPFVLNLPSLSVAAEGASKQRLVVLFSPNGVEPSTFGPRRKGHISR
jgi:hypothetical protein